MRLKSIKLAGFKSFVDLTKVELPSSITAVIGPNGCGKSNIIDAVRWVMGEISAKYLRGESMADVIFSGSVNRSPVAQAAIELHFENTTGRLGGEYSTYNEVVIRRQVSRDGQSNYYLNGARCRRKDITDVFLGTGLGSRSYAIIEQGMITRMIEAKPEDLRVFLEEAAGISRYKERRKETEQRIEHTRDNLARINDLREELAKQVGHLERQAKTAERYKQLKTEERSLRAQLFVLRHQQLQQELNFAQAQLAELGTNLQDHETSYAELSEQLQHQFDSQHQRQEHLQQAQQAYAELHAAIRVCEQNITHNKNQQQQFEHELKQMSQQQIEAERLCTLDSSSIEQLTQDLETIQSELLTLSAQLDEKRSHHQLASEQQRQWQAQWQEINLNVATHSQTAQVEQTRMQQIEQRLQQIKQQQQKLIEEQEHLQAQEDESKLHALQAELHQLENQRDEQKFLLQQQEETLQALHLKQRELVSTLHDAHRQLQQHEGKLTALNTLQQQALGQHEQNLKNWLDKHQLQQAERLANLIEVDAGFETYLEHYLGEKLQAISLTDFEQVSTLISDFPQGHLDFVAGKNIHSSSLNQGAAICLAQKIKGPKVILDKLEHVYCAENITQALTLIQSLPQHAEVITPDGLLVQRDWIQIRRGKDEQSGVLQRKREIAALQETLTQLKNTIAETEQQKQQLDAEIHQAEENKKQQQASWQNLDLDRNHHFAQVQIQQSRLQQRQQRLQTLSQELETAEMESQQITLEHASSREIWQGALGTLNEHHRTRDELAAQQQSLDESLAQSNRYLRETEETLQHLRLKQQRFSSEQQGLISQRERTVNQLQQLEQRHKFLQEQLEMLTPTLAEFEEELLIHNEQLATIEATLEQARTDVNEGEQNLRRIEAERQTISQNLERLRQTFSTHQIQAEHAQTKSHSILEQFQELDLVFEEVAANLPAELIEGDCQAQLEQTQSRIERLGAINLAAISELTEQLTRKEFIEKQYQDLIDSLTTLETAIAEIDKESKVRFEETYNTVNENFKHLFPKIFNGGNAYLSLTSENLLETGVIVFAQPPGKRNSSIHLLSGGEKALTALALVFSIFQLNPAPFCMLDEVDAPLDDANVGRFCNLVKAMSEKTQFILVTHNKVAMEMADHLMGVTMQEPGVSRLVAVDVEAAIAMAAQ